MTEEVSRAYEYLVPRRQRIVDVLILELAAQELKIIRISKEALKLAQDKKQS